MWVIPTFFPKSPKDIYRHSQSLTIRYPGSINPTAARLLPHTDCGVKKLRDDLSFPGANKTFRKLPVEFPPAPYRDRKPLSSDFDKNTRGNIQFPEGVNGFCRRFSDIDNALMRAQFELFSRLLVNVRPPEHGVPLDTGWQGYGA